MKDGIVLKEVRGGFDIYRRSALMAPAGKRYFVMRRSDGKHIDDHATLRAAREMVAILMAVASGQFAITAFPDIYFPNWFYRSDIEEYAGRTLTDAEWDQFREQDGQAELISKVVDEYAKEYFKK